MSLVLGTRGTSADRVHLQLDSDGHSKLLRISDKNMQNEVHQRLRRERQYGNCKALIRGRLDVFVGKITSSFFYFLVWVHTEIQTKPELLEIILPLQLLT